MSLEPFVSRVKALPAEKSEKGYGDENGRDGEKRVVNFTLPLPPAQTSLGSSRDISKPRYFEVFCRFPWDIEIAGFDCTLEVITVSHFVCEFNVRCIVSFVAKINNDAICDVI